MQHQSNPFLNLVDLLTGSAGDSPTGLAMKLLANVLVDSAPAPAANLVSDFAVLMAVNVADAEVMVAEGSAG